MQIKVLHVVDLHTSTQGKNSTKKKALTLDGSVRCIAANEGKKASGSRTEIKVLQIFAHAGSEGGLSDTEKICCDVLKRQRNNRFNNNKKKL